MVRGGLCSGCRRQGFLKEEGKEVEVRVGSVIANESIAGIATDREAIEYLRWRTYLRARRSKPENSWPAVMRTAWALKTREAIVHAVQPELLADELAALPEDRCLLQNGDFAVYLTRADEVPQLMQEVGRLREVTFREAGEGTGKGRDLDRFDTYYWHLLLWHKTRRELVGAYRAGDTTELLTAHGIRGASDSPPHPHPAT